MELGLEGHMILQDRIGQDGNRPWFQYTARQDGVEVTGQDGMEVTGQDRMEVPQDRATILFLCRGLVHTSAG